jgi:hypothetical protein
MWLSWKICTSARKKQKQAVACQGGLQFKILFASLCQCTSHAFDDTPSQLCSPSREIDNDPSTVLDISIAEDSAPIESFKALHLENDT